MPVPMWVSVLFIVLTVITTSLCVLILKRAVLQSDLSDSTKVSLIRRFGLASRIWIMITAVLGITDFFSDFSSTPPRIILGVLPALFFLIWLSRSSTMGKLIATLPITAVYYLQFFRVIVEIELYQLWHFKLVPESVTFAGRNFDILVGLTAPLIGRLVYQKKSLPPTAALVWNILGIILLTNVVTTGILSTPSPMRMFFEDYANTAMGIFPFVWLPMVLVPIAFALHIMAIRFYLHTKNSK